MKRTSMEEKSETALRTSLELATLYAALCPVPNIVGPAYGAAHCKRASNVVRAFERLLESLEFSILRSTYYANQAELDAWRSYPSRDARNWLRERIGEPPFTEEQKRSPRHGFDPPLSAAEHLRLGADLKNTASALSKAEAVLGNAFGKDSDLRRRAARANRLLLTLRTPPGQRRAPGTTPRDPRTKHLGHLLRPVIGVTQ